jgi:enoyl-CoA hydratase/carnithine racemase
MRVTTGCLRWQEYGNIGAIKISNPPSNGLPSPEFAEINTIREWIEQDHIWGVILHGEGRHFSAGADMEYFKDTNMNEDGITGEIRAGVEVLEYIERVEKPVIASIDGVCLGGGLEIALACHMRFCSKDAVFGFPEINHGLIPCLSGIRRLVETAGRAKALEILLTGEIFGAREAHEIGIVNQIIDDKSSYEFVISIIGRITKKGRKAVSYAIKAVNNSLFMDLEDAMKEESRMFFDLVVNGYTKG